MVSRQYSDFLRTTKRHKFEGRDRRGVRDKMNKDFKPRGTEPSELHVNHSLFASHETIICKYRFVTADCASIQGPMSGLGVRSCISLETDMDSGGNSESRFLSEGTDKDLTAQSAGKASTSPLISNV